MTMPESTQDHEALLDTAKFIVRRARRRRLGLPWAHKVLECGTHAPVETDTIVNAAAATILSGKEGQCLFAECDFLVLAANSAAALASEVLRLHGVDV
jgi:hypothetical protein